MKIVTVTNLYLVLKNLMNSAVIKQVLNTDVTFKNSNDILQ